jgi:cytochrome c oxidase subunit 4
MADHHPKTAEAEHEHHPGAHSPRTYIVVFIVLMLLAGATYAMGEGRLGAWSLPFAMTVACIKAGLVLAFFMHLAEHKGAVRLTVAVAVFFIGLLIAITIGDVATRFKPANPRHAPFGIEPRAGAYQAPPGVPTKGH